MVSGVPDMWIGYKGECLFIENKKLGKEPSENQKRIHDKIRQAGFKVYVVDDFERFKSILNESWGLE